MNRPYSDRKFITLLESAPDSMVITGNDGRIIIVNKQTEILFGYSRDEIIGKEIEVLIPERFHHRHKKDRTAYHATPRTRPMGIGLELSGRKKDGMEFPVEVSLSPLKWEDSGETLTIAAIRDVTTQIQVRAELTKRTRELEIINRELEAFSYSVSHDLRAPLRIIEGFSNKILSEFSGSLDEPAGEYFRMILKAGKQMGLLIDDLLKLARLTKTEIMPECIDISEIARSIVNELTASEPDRSAEIIIEPHITACVDRNLIKIALQNLFENAWKYSRNREKTIIEFGWSGKNGNIVHFIKDNGVGFNMKYAGSLFKAFQRLHTRSEFEGTGIGLATVRRVIERHRGDIWVESEENKGTTFYFTLFSKS